MNRPYVDPLLSQCRAWAVGVGGEGEGEGVINIMVAM